MLQMVTVIKKKKNSLYWPICLSTQRLITQLDGYRLPNRKKKVPLLQVLLTQQEARVVAKHLRRLMGFLGQNMDRSTQGSREKIEWNLNGEKNINQM